MADAVARDLARGLAKGDMLALQSLYDAYAPGVFALAMRRLSDAGAAEEIVQDVFFKIWQARALFDASKSDLSTWLFAIARNAVYDRLRNEARRARSAQVTQSAMLEQFAAVEGSSLELIISEERVREILGRLPPEQREIVRLVCVDGRTVADAARVLATPLGTAKSRLRAAMRNLRQQLSVGGMEE